MRLILDLKQGYHDYSHDGTVSSCLILAEA